MDTLSSGSANLFKKPGTTTNGVISWLIPLAAISAVVWFFGGPIGAFLVNAFDNILHLAIVGGIIIFLGALVLDPKKRAWYMYRSLTRWITSQFVDIDPIGILKSYKERMENKLHEMMDSISALKGQRVKTKRHQDDNDAALQNEYCLMQQAQKIGDTNSLGVHGKQAARLEFRKQRYVGEMNRLNLLINIMDKYYKLCDTTILDMTNEIGYREQEREEARQSRKAVGAAMSIIKGLPEKELWDEATLKLENDYSAAIGEVENFLDVTKDILAQSDLQDGADTDKAMQLLDEWTKKNSNVSIGSQGAQMSKAAIIQEAAQQISGSPASVNSGKPAYQQVVQSTGGDDYLSMAK